MRHLKEENGTESKSWAGIIVEFMDAVVKNISYSVSRNVKEKQERILRKFIAGLFVFVGFLFFLNGLAVFINEYVGRNLSSWLGYMAVGFLVALFGALFPKK